MKAESRKPSQDPWENNCHRSNLLITRNRAEYLHALPIAIELQVPVDLSHHDSPVMGQFLSSTGIPFSVDLSQETEIFQLLGTEDIR